MTLALAILFGLISFGLTIAGAFMNERGGTEGERLAGLFCIGVGMLFALGGILLGLMALVPNL